MGRTTVPFANHTDERFVCCSDAAICPIGRGPRPSIAWLDPYARRHDGALADSAGSPCAGSQLHTPTHASDSALLNRLWTLMECGGDAFVCLSLLRDQNHS